MRSETKVILGIIAIIVLIVGIIIVFDKKNVQSDGLKNGEEAPDFRVADYSGKTISKSDYQGKNILLYFNEGVGCPPCWQQDLSLQKKEEKFVVLNTAIVTIVVDPADAVKSTVQGYKITLPVLADTSKKMSMAYKILDMRSSMHMGEKPGHTFVLVGADNKIKWVGDYPQMNVTEDEILEKVKNALI